MDNCRRFTNMFTYHMKRFIVGLELILLLGFLSCSCSRGQVTFVTHTIDPSAGGTACLHACDLDGDGNTDLIGALLEENALVWWQNKGGNPVAWKRLTIAEEFAGAISVSTGDLDRDGDIDVVGAAAEGDEVAWWQNCGGSPPTWVKFTIRGGYDFAHEVHVYDLDQDGDDDVLGASSFLDEITWWRNDGGEPLVWTEQPVGDHFSRAKSVRVADLDSDGDLDVIGAALGDNEVSWWRNEGGDPIHWTKSTISDDFQGAHRVQLVDFEGDGDIDILGAAYLGGEIAWWRSETDTAGSIAFSKERVALHFDRACIAASADMDGDGDLDVVGTSQAGNQVAWWRNEGGSPIQWVKTPIDSLVRVWPLCLADLDGDGGIDVIAASGFKGVNTVKWWKNR
jgi:hypothetical protein